MLPNAWKSSQTIEDWKKNDFIRGRMYLFPGEDVLVEVELDLLIGDVDAELLKRVPLKVFKAKDVQNTDV